MEYTEAAVREFLTTLVSEALADSKPQLAVRFAQGRLIQRDPVSVTCTWSLPAEGGGTRPSREFDVRFSGDAIGRFVTYDAGRRARMRSAAIEAIRSRYREFDPAATQPAYPYLCQIDYVGV